MNAHMFWETQDHPQTKPHHTTQREKDLFYMSMAKLAATRSKCASRKIGAVLVRDDCILSWGCNSAPPGINLCQDPNAPCPRQEAGYESGEGLHICPAQHAERNAILHAAKKGISTKDSTLYCYCGLPCLECAKAIVCSGITRLVYLNVNGANNTDPNGHKIIYDQLSVQILKDITKCGIYDE